VLESNNLRKISRSKVVAETEQVVAEAEQKAFSIGDFRIPIRGIEGSLTEGREEHKEPNTERSDAAIE
jgi:hypothetical protein